MAEKEYIERDAVLDLLTNRDVVINANDEVAFIREDVECLPDADVRPIVRSRWKYIEYYPEGHDYKCQKCRFKNAEPTNYCPSCGAVMMGVEA